MKVAIITQYYPPEPVLIAHALAHGLADRGHDVRVVTAYPNYPNGKLVDGFRQTWRHLEADGRVQVRRVPVFISHSRNPLGRLLNYASFSLSSLFAGRFVRKADVVYVYATQMTAAVGPSIWHRLHGTPFVLHVQDIWPESITGSSMLNSKGVKRVVGVALKPWLRRMYGRAAATIAIGPTMARVLQDRGVAANRIHTVYNWADETPERQTHAAVTDGASTSGSCNVMYAGNIGNMQGLETVIRAAGLVRDLEGFLVHIVGSGVEEGRLKVMAAKLGLSNVIFHGRVRPEQMDQYYAKSDFQLVSLKDLEIFRATIPSKLQASLANGVPVITTVAGDVGDLVVDNGVGFRSEPEDIQGLAHSFRAAYAMSDDEKGRMGERARSFYSESMSRSNGIDRIERILLSEARMTKRTPTTTKDGRQ